MNTFKINSIIKGLDTEIIVAEPSPWDSNTFAIKFQNDYIGGSFKLNIERGHWLLAEIEHINNNSKEPNLEQLEINGIGYQISKQWSQRLEKQLDFFQLYI